ncbi:phage tail protein [Emticicia sp. 21SJ11W-3]|uniref:phage tail protein n=1 Tax=Emticicia sp. 21SJ11W-3 TaxID=2916755 RepID=UPI00209CF693|nr:tail fiber protein [Emticicia sp. 21SJ11W-3]UTA68944.1 tail fiber protein [Emticicia sp. 21SJ11W-3]
MDEYVGTIKIFAGDYAPRNYLKCEGQTLPIMTYQALFALLGTTYGGDGRNTFMLPDLRGRLIVQTGQMPGSPNYRRLGEKGGEEKVTLTLSNIPPHTHTYSALSGNRESPNPQNNYLGNTASTFYAQKGPDDKLVAMAPGAVGTIGGQPHENMPPFIVLNYIICTFGLYPPRP